MPMIGDGGGSGRAPVGERVYFLGMPILAAFDDWWLASPRFRYFQAPPAADDAMSRHSVPRLGLRFAGTLMHRALPAAAITDG